MYTNYYKMKTATKPVIDNEALLLKLMYMSENNTHDRKVFFLFPCSF